MVLRSNEGGNSTLRLMPMRTIDKPKDHRGMKISFRGSGVNSTPALSLPCQSSNQTGSAAITGDDDDDDDDEKNKFYKISHLKIRNFLCFPIFNRLKVFKAIQCKKHNCPPASTRTSELQGLLTNLLCGFSSLVAEQVQESGSPLHVV